MAEILLGIDFEEWFHPQLIQSYLTNDEKEFKVTRGLDKILNLLHKHDTVATFFIVGEIVKKFPDILDKIISDGHEIGFHTMKHSRLDSPGFENFFSEELKEFSILTNNKSKGFRAPSFSLNSKSSWIINELEKFNYVYDSSVVPTNTGMYGIPDAPKTPYYISEHSLEKNDPEGKILEFPLMVTDFLGKTIPACGGFYLRFLPFFIMKKTLRIYEKLSFPGAFFIHSWELTPEFMPKIEMSIKDKFITYHNLDSTYDRMNSLLSEYRFTSFENFFKKI